MFPIFFLRFRNSLLLYKQHNITTDGNNHHNSSIKKQEKSNRGKGFHLRCISVFYCLNCLIIKQKTTKTTKLTEIIFFDDDELHII
jgi:hypothetical protein